MRSRAVLLLAYGGPNSLADIPAYLSDIRGGQPVSPALLEETMRRYILIGGRSSLLDITKRLAAKLQNKIGLPVYLGMRHWHPRIVETVREMTRDGITHATVICLAPHYSEMSIGAYKAKLEQAIASCDCENHRTTKQSPTFDFIDAWHTQPLYIQALTKNARTALAQIDTDAKIIFTAHSLPVAAREPYAAQLHETAQLVAQNLGLRDDRWMLAYQSKPRAPGEWLEPQIEKTVPQLAAEGKHNFIIAPIGFLADHLEVLYDLDIGLQEIARVNNARVVRTPMLNDSDALVEALAKLVKERNVERQ